MNINTRILNEIDDCLNDYDCHRPEIEDVLTTRVPFSKKQEDAIQVIKGIMTVHGKKELHKYLAELARIEYRTRELEPEARDHVVHALLSFVLGIYINEKFLRSPYTPGDHFQWKIAGLLHDIGYPVQVAAKDILEPFTSKIKEIKREIGVPARDVSFKIVPDGLENLTNGLNSFDLIQERLNEWNLQINAKKEYDRMIGTGKICHGIISSLAVLYVIDLMYKKYNPEREYSNIYADQRGVNWDQTHFERDVISACSAIYIHNLPDRCFASAKIDRSKAPVAFLLKLSDCLQEWERPSSNNQKGFAATKFDIQIDCDKLILYADIPDDRKKKIRKDISSSLVVPDVKICSK